MTLSLIITEITNEIVITNTMTDKPSPLKCSRELEKQLQDFITDNYRKNYRRTKSFKTLVKKKLQHVKSLNQLPT
jgi:hypothetical protein